MQIFATIAHSVAAVGLTVAVFFGFHHPTTQLNINQAPPQTTFVYVVSTPTAATSTPAVNKNALKTTPKLATTKAITGTSNKPVQPTPAIPAPVSAVTPPKVTTPTSTPVVTVITVPPVTTVTTTSQNTSSTPSNSGSNTTAQSTPVVAGTMQWGIFLGDGAPQSLTSFVSQVDASPNIEATFVGWDDNFPSNFSSTLCGSNKTLLIFWENYGYSLDNIIAGQYDSYLKNFSQQAQSYGCPVILSLFHEMNGNWDDWDGTMGDNSPAKIIAAWQHVHNLVTASNVKWIWVVNNDSVPDTAANAINNYYPGSSYVDYVGVDGFNFGSPWETFAQTFDSSVAALQQYNKPIYLTSMGSIDGPEKAQWISDLGTHIQAYPNVVGWVWFDENQSQQNWLIDSDPASLAAFKAVVN